MFDSLVDHEVPGVYASAHGGHSSLRSKESYVSAKAVSTKAINKILANSLSGENSSNFNELVNVERSKENDKIDKIKRRGKENISPGPALQNTSALPTAGHSNLTFEPGRAAQDSPNLNQIHGWSHPQPPTALGQVHLHHDRVQGQPHLSAGQNLPVSYHGSQLNLPLNHAGVQQPLGHAGVQQPLSHAGVQQRLGHVGVQQHLSHAGVQQSSCFGGALEPASLGGAELPASLAGGQMLTYPAGQHVPVSSAEQFPSSWELLPVSGVHPPNSFRGQQLPTSFAGTLEPANFQGQQRPAISTGAQLPASLVGNVHLNLGGHQLPTSTASLPRNYGGQQFPASLGALVPTNFREQQLFDSPAGPVAQLPVSFAGQQFPPSITQQLNNFEVQQLPAGLAGANVTTNFCGRQPSVNLSGARLPFGVTQGSPPPLFFSPQVVSPSSTVYQNHPGNIPSAFNIATSPQYQLGATSQCQLGATSPQYQLGATSPQYQLGAPSPQYQLGATSPQYQLGYPAQQLSYQNQTLSSHNQMMPFMAPSAFDGRPSMPAVPQQLNPFQFLGRVSQPPSSLKTREQQIEADGRGYYKLSKKESEVSYNGSNG